MPDGIFAEIGSEMADLRREQAYRRKMRRAYDNWRVRWPWRWLPVALRAGAFRRFGIPKELRRG